MKELVKIQSELKVPKGQYNSFGGYKYRSCEDILEAVKPLLAKTGCALILTDEITVEDGWHYITATARLINSAGQVIETQGHAREEAQRKGYDASQLSGSASSYARKYALNGLFAIDDTKDSDATNTHGKEAVKSPTSFDEIIAMNIDIVSDIAKIAKDAENKVILQRLYKENKEVLTADDPVAMALKNLIIAKGKTL